MYEIFSSSTLLPPVAVPCCFKVSLHNAKEFLIVVLFYVSLMINGVEHQLMRIKKPIDKTLPHVAMMLNCALTSCLH